jgi:7-keto-8-aminopelargonate synthetase-like enzyme
MSDEPQRQTRVRALAARVRAGLGEPGDCPIVPVILGVEASALRAAEELREQGMLVLPVRPPTVPRGSSRLRVTLSCDHSDGEIDALIGALRAQHSARQEKTDGGQAIG